MKILITGGAGFVGSALAISLKANYPSYEILALDNLKRRGSELNLSRLKKAGVDFLHGDIRSKEDFDALPAVDKIIEASAEPSVLAGLDGTPDYLINTNLFGTINCLNYALKHRADFIFLSTSRVYPIKTLETLNFEEAETRFVLADAQPVKGASAQGIAEDFPLDGPRSLYGTTKLASELIIQEYNEFYGLKTVINRCGVITGPWQMGKVDQGVMVLWIAKHYFEQQLSYIGYGGTGKQTRDMLHIADLYRLIDWQLHNLEQVNGEILNAGGGVQSSASLQELTKVCQEVTGKTIPIKQVTENRTADIRLYVTDNRKVTRLTGWQPQIGIKQIVTDIHEWLDANRDALAPILK
ncbi:MAG: NAD-dependent epimerase/dehydratase family protein [Runella slithyformis]|nr:MAG: NAD-dependent epimerase/dehydratase family protein [Runella slithyformis]TAF96821.1 MAG: NAD-dependent epimerase/dehydratase family protein [Runella sp.]TAG20674.1 MAG: NAD-dependent epimerase/dehydratase family protein [Cytophagales bacterium]TAG39833.1 MAG: NAD-dependent epimerase/dehydratase family protein [Cytophagia bacterium]TAE98377.1 MAG: NAD-dependent epimerase/dehydratase family protein [Runella slithyformis]